ncbi:MAG: HNH endonuclease, partial [Acidimicrobiales bacterium]
VVAACRPCNIRKRDHLLHEIGLRLRHHPRTPLGAAWLIVAGGTVPDDWEPYLSIRFHDHSVAVAG